MSCWRRAHYSAGQVYALQHQWQLAEESYRRCAQLSTDEQSRGQALYCVGVACHHQGKFEDALVAYSGAGDTTGMLPMKVLGTVRALNALGRTGEASAAASDFLSSPAGKLCPDLIREALIEVRPF